MDLYKQGMKGPSRPAPAVPALNVNRYSPVTNWNDDPFGVDVFEPTPNFRAKKVPPPRPPPPKLNKNPDISAKPSHFIRKPTVLTTILSRNKMKTVKTNNTLTHQTVFTDCSNDGDSNKVFLKCDSKNIQTGTLIDLSSPPSSPTFTTRSSSDGLSVDSFGSDATTSTNHNNAHNGGNASQAESGFEDDFDLFFHTRKNMPKDDTLDDFTTIDPFSPQPVQKPAVMKKVISKDFFDSSNSQPSVPVLKGPTIIRAKPARPKPPDSTALLRNTLGNNFPITSMNLNTTTPIQKVANNFADNFDSKPIGWDSSNTKPLSWDSADRESSPPMPSIPPPPPPVDVADDLPLPEDIPADWLDQAPEDEEPYAIALYDYFTDHHEDLCFSRNSRITLIRRLDDEWLFGSTKNGAQGLFPSNYVDIKVPLPNETLPTVTKLGLATALYDFETTQLGDLPFLTGDVITVLYKINDEWYFGECNGRKGQFPVNYVQMS